MTTALDVANYIAARKQVSGKMQLLKLVYYAQAWSLAWDGKPLFSEPVEAWKMGPVVRSVHYCAQTPDLGALPLDQAVLVDAVISYYGKFYGTTLSTMTHKEAPWKNVWERSGKQLDWGCDEIPQDDMRRYYTERALAGEGPRRPVAAATPASDADVMQSSYANAERWRETLAILAQ